MEIRQFFSVLLLCLLLCQSGICFEDDYDDGRDSSSFGRCPWIRNKLKNGRVKIRSKGRLAKFLCDPGYELAGKRYATCVRGEWNNPIPVCVARGCSRLPHVSNGKVTEMYRGAMLVYDCNPGYALNGDLSVYCDGRRWNAKQPTCVVATTNPEVSCDFENPDLCGWSHDPTHDFDWKRNQFATPSGHVGTGPTYDHTFGVGRAGYYLYLEASSPRKPNDAARLFSPVYSKDYSDGCFVFWYHMFGATIGSLRVYVKPESHVFDESLPLWDAESDQGNEWFEGHVSLPRLQENFQIVIEGIIGSGYMGDTAIDDVLLSNKSCDSIINKTSKVEYISETSCRGRCHEHANIINCKCDDECYINRNCCEDFSTLCVSGNGTAVENPNEELPDQELGKTSTLMTVPISTAIPTAPFEILTPIPETRQPTFSSTNSDTVPFTFSTTKSENTASSEISTQNIQTTSNVSNILTTVAVEYWTTREITQHAFSTPSYTVSQTTSNAAYQNVTPETSAKPNVTFIPERETVPTLPKSKNTTQSFTSTTALKTEPTLSSSTSKTTSAIVPTTNEPTSALTGSNPLTTTSVKTSITTTTITTPITPTFFKTAPATMTMSTTNIPSTVTDSVTNTTVETNTTKELIPTESSSTLTSTIMSSTDTTTDVTTKRYNLRPRTTRTYISSTTPIITTSIKTSTYVPTRKTFTPTRLTQSTTAKPTPVPTTTLRTTTVYYMLRTKSITPFRTRKHSFPITIPLKTYSTTPETFKFQSYKSVSSTVKSSTSPTVTIVSVCVVVILCLGLGFLYYRKQIKTKRQSKLSDDSELRFLSENDEATEYSDPSVLDKILIK